MDQVKWGVLSTGMIAEHFTKAICRASNARPYAVASSSLQKAEEFGHKYGFEKCYGSYEELASDPEVEVIYIGTPHPVHLENILMCIEHGKNVLCEKPIGMNAEQVHKMADAARRKKVFLAEGLWSRYFPAVAKMKEWIADGRIGELRMFEGSFCYAGGRDYTKWRWNKDYGGGGLLDVGIYPIAFAQDLFGSSPLKTVALPSYSPTHVDEQAGIVMTFPGGKMAVMSCGIMLRNSGTGHIVGELGRIDMTEFWRCNRAVLLDNDENVVEVFEADPVLPEMEGMQHEAEAISGYIREGLLESPRIPLDQSIEIAEILDSIRADWGYRFPADHS